MFNPFKRASKTQIQPPAQIVMAVTSRCNLRCVMCEHSVMKVDKKDFDLNLVDRMGDFFASASTVDLTGLGEPLLSDTFWEVLDRYPVRSGADEEAFLGFTTNGTQLTRQNNERLLRSRLRTIRVSLDAADQRAFQEIRKTDISPILDGTRRLIAVRNASRREFPRIGVHMTWMRRTLHDVPAMIDLSKDLGADFLEVFAIHERASEALDSWHQLDGADFQYRANLLSGVEPSEMSGLIEDAKAYAESKGLPIQLRVFETVRSSDDFPHENEDWVRRKKAIEWKKHSIRCPMPFLEMFIHYDGEAHPCCWSPLPVGDLRDNTLEEIWHGDVMRSVRADLIDGNVPPICSGASCPYLKGQAKKSRPAEAEWGS